MNHSLNTAKSITLIELLISIIIVTMMVLSFYGLETFSHGQVINSERRAKVQNQLAYVLEHMSKYVQQAGGNINYPAITLYPTLGAKTGFQIQVDLNPTQTPSDFSDDALVYYTLSGNTLSTGCTARGTGTCGTFSSEVLINRIVANFNNGVLPANPSDGFYVLIDSLGNLVDIGLVGRYDPSSPVSSTNPQVEMKTRVICNNCSAN